MSILMLIKMLANLTKRLLELCRQPVGQKPGLSKLYLSNVGRGKVSVFTLQLNYSLFGTIII